MVNFVKFCELLIKNCPNLRRIALQTQPASLIGALEELKGSLQGRGVELAINCRENMHDREIRWKNWLVELRGKIKKLTDLTMAGWSKWEEVTKQIPQKMLKIFLRSRHL